MSTTKNKTTILKEKKGKTLHITIGSMNKYPVLHSETVKEFSAAVRSGIRDNSISTIIVSGRNQSFCTGLDINDFRNLTNNKVMEGVKLGATVLDELEISDKFSIAVVNGYCVGGGFEITLAFDYIIATPTAKFSLPEIKIGLIPGAGGIKRLVRQVGKRKSMNLLLTGRTITAKEALNMGLIDEISNSWNIMNRAEMIAEKVNSQNPAAVAAIKKIAAASEIENTTEKGISEFKKCLGTQQAKDAISAFIDKKK